MTTSYLRMPDAELAIWSENLAQQLTAAPAEFHVTAEQVAAYVTANTEFERALSAWRSNATRTPIAFVNKKTARESLLSLARYLVNSIDSNPVTTDAQRDQLGIRIRRKPAPVPVPTTAPIVDVISVQGRRVTIGLHATEVAKRGKPTGAKGANVFSFVGEAAPTDSAMWKFEGLFTRTKFELTIAGSVQATTVWISVNWYNERGETSIGSAPISVHLPTSTVTPFTNGIRIAA